VLQSQIKFQILVTTVVNVKSAITPCNTAIVERIFFLIVVGGLVHDHYGDHHRAGPHAGPHADPHADPHAGHDARYHCQLGG
jgi:hypothetical protein